VRAQASPQPYLARAAELAPARGCRRLRLCVGYFVDSGLAAWRCASRCAGVSVVTVVEPGAPGVVVTVAAPCAPATPGVVVVALLGVVAAAPGVVAAMLGVVAAGAVAAGALAVVIVVVTAGLAVLEPPASLTSAAASTPSASTATTAIATIGAFQFGVAASRVRAAAPQRRHQSWSGPSGVAQSGQASLAGDGVASGIGSSALGAASSALVCCPGAVALVTSRRPAGG
jgi:hypothetical protein